jgi:hypothetical protein
MIHRPKIVPVKERRLCTSVGLWRRGRPVMPAFVRWIARASVSFRTKILKINGRGDAYHSWKRDQP